MYTISMTTEREHLQEQQYLAGEREAEIAELRNDPEYHAWLDGLNAQPDPCQHPYIKPNGDCIDCGVFVTSAPGLVENHTVVRNSNTNFSLARWSAKTGKKLSGRRDGDNAKYEIEIANVGELVFKVYRDGEFYRSLRLVVSGTAQERQMFLPGVAMDAEWFDEFILEPQEV